MRETGVSTGLAMCVDLDAMNLPHSLLIRLPPGGDPAPTIFISSGPARAPSLSSPNGSLPAVRWLANGS